MEETEVFLKVPIAESFVPGFSVAFEHVNKNILTDHPRADCLLPEQLWMFVEHDGSNPFCAMQKCQWQMLFLAPNTELPVEVRPDDDEAITQLVCLPHQRFIERVIIEEGTHSNVAGIWLLVEIVDADGVVTEQDEYDLGFNLVPYGNAG